MAQEKAPTQPFAVFCGSKYYPLGGWDDLLSTHPTLETAKDAVIKHAVEGNTTDWVQIVDLRDGTIVYKAPVA